MLHASLHANTIGIENVFARLSLQLACLTMDNTIHEQDRKLLNNSQIKVVRHKLDIHLLQCRR